MTREHGMHRPNDFMSDGQQVNDHAFLCITGANYAFGLQVQECNDDYDWSEEFEIGLIDAPCYTPAGGCMYFEDFLGFGIEQQIVSR